MKKLITIIIVSLLIGLFGYNYLYQDHRDIESEKPEFAIAAQDLAKEFSENSIAAEQKYLNKTIEVSGKLTEINNNNLTLSKVVFCSFNESISKKIVLNSNLIVKGRLIGYDDLLEQIKIDQTTIIN